MIKATERGRERERERYTYLCMFSLDAGAEESGPQLWLIHSCGPLVLQDHLHGILTNLHRWLFLVGGTWSWSSCLSLNWPGAHSTLLIINFAWLDEVTHLSMQIFKSSVWQRHYFIAVTFEVSLSRPLGYPHSLLAIFSHRYFNTLWKSIQM